MYATGECRRIPIYLDVRREDGLRRCRYTIEVYSEEDLLQMPTGYKIPPIAALAIRRSETSAMPDVDESSQYECLLITDVVVVSLPP